MDNLIKKYKARELSFKTPIAAKLFAFFAGVMPTSFLAAQGESGGTELGHAVSKGTWAIVEEIAHVYCGSLFLLFLAIDVLVLAFSKNEKAISIAKGSLVAILVCYVVFRLILNGTIASTVNQVGEFFQ